MERCRDLYGDLISKHKYRPEYCYYQDELPDCKLKIYSDSITRNQQEKYLGYGRVIIILCRNEANYKIFRGYFDSSGKTFYLRKSYYKSFIHYLDICGYSMSRKSNFYYVTAKSGKTVCSKRKYVPSKLQSWRDNPDILFIFDTKTNTIHDKTCEHLNRIPMHWLKPFEGYLLGINYCDNCREYLHIRLACGDDFKRCNVYKYFLHKGKLSQSSLENFVRHRNFRMRLISPESLEIKVNEDTWIINRDGDGSYTLMHNNYFKLDDGNRIVSEGRNAKFHLQRRSRRLYPLFDSICRYSYGEHPQYTAEDPGMSSISLKTRLKLLLGR